MRFLDATYTLRIRNPNHAECGVRGITLDGKPVGTLERDKRLGRKIALIPIGALKRGENHVIEVTL